MTKMKTETEAQRLPWVRDWLFQLSFAHLYFEFESTSWSDPSGAKEGAKSGLWAMGQGLCTEKPRNGQQLVKC